MALQTASCAKGFSVKVKAYSSVNLPDILDLKDKTIKYIDVMNGVINKDLNDDYISSNNALESCYINLMEKGTQNLFIKDLSINTLNPFFKQGERDIVLKKIDMLHSFIQNNSANDLNIYFVFWYDDISIANVIQQNKANFMDFVEVSQFDSVSNKSYFPDNRTLIGKKISFFDFNIRGGFKTPNMKTNVANSDMLSCYLTLVKNNYMFIENVPLVCFTTINMINVIKLQNVVFDLQNSYIAFPNSVKANVAGKVFFCNVEYQN